MSERREERDTERCREECREVERCSDVYEDALRRHDVEALNALFWDDPRALRFGVADGQVGYAAISAWRATAPPIAPHRSIVFREIVSLARGVVAVDLAFDDGDASTVGRQSQTWVRTADGWRIARAHVSIVPR